MLRPVYDRTAAVDGYVSLEVAPDLAHDTPRTIAEARRLWKTVNRPNVMIKVPATPEGVPAIRELLAEGININITLLFARSAYEAVAAAYLEAFEARVAKGQPIDRIASVASFFVSRIDSLVDALQIAEKLKTASPRRSAGARARSRGRSRSPPRSWHTRATSVCLLARGGTRSRRRARIRSVCCGPARVRRTRSTATRCTSRNSSGRIRSTRFRPRRSRRSANTAPCAPASWRTWRERSGDSGGARARRASR